MANFWQISPDGIALFLNCLRNAALPNVLNTLTLRLWQNNFTPVSGTLLAAFTEMNFGGYVAIATTNWAPAVANAKPPDYDVTDLTRTFSCNAVLNLPQTVYGAYLTDSAGAGGAATKWYAAWRSELADAATPVIIDAVGKSYLFTPRLTMSEYHAYP